jgi:hypothetical protein
MLYIQRAFGDKTVINVYVIERPHGLKERKNICNFNRREKNNVDQREKYKMVVQSTRQN